MEYFHSLSNDLVRSASGRILGMVVKDHTARVVDEFPSANLGVWIDRINHLPDSPKLRHWLSVSRSLIRARVQIMDPEPRFMVHFDVDDLAPGRIAELHMLRGLELCIDHALSSGEPLSLQLKGIRCPPRWHVWGFGTLRIPDNTWGIEVDIGAYKNGTLEFGSHRVEFIDGELRDLELQCERDCIVATPSGDVVIASTIAGLGDAYHSSAPVIKSVTAIETWANTLTEAVQRLERIDPSLASDCIDLARAICPIHCGGTAFGSSSPAEVIGLVFLPGTTNSYDVAECLLHESLHQKLYHAEEGSPLFVGENGDEEIYYSPWRSDPRPLRMLVHGAYVFTGVAHLWKTIGETADDADIARNAAFHMHYRAGQAQKAIQSVRKYGKLTVFGEKMTELINEGLADIAGVRAHNNYVVSQSTQRQQDHLKAFGHFVH